MYKHFQSRLLCHIQTFIISDEYYYNECCVILECSGVGGHIIMGIMILYLIFMHAHIYCMSGQQTVLIQKCNRKS